MSNVIDFFEKKAESEYKKLDAVYDISDIVLTPDELIDTIDDYIIIDTPEPVNDDCDH